MTTTRSTLLMPVLFLLSCATSRQTVITSHWRESPRTHHSAAWPVALPSGQDAGLPDFWLATVSKSAPWTVQSATCEGTLSMVAATCKISTRPGMDVGAPEALAGQPMTFGLHRAEGLARYFHGYVHWVERSSDRVTLVLGAPPALLMKAAGNAIFHERSVPEVVAAVMARYPQIAYSLELSRSYPVHEVIAQYRETDLNFLQRLLEHVGIFSYVRHEPGGPVWVFGDSFATHSGLGAAPLMFATADDIPGTLFNVTVSAQPGPARYSLEYDDGSPTHTRAMATSSVQNGVGTFDTEIRDREGTYRSAEEARWFASLRLGETRPPFRLEGLTSDLRMSVGHRFRLEKHPDSDRNREYIVVRATFEVVMDDDVRNGPISIEAVPVDSAWRPNRESPIPSSDGIDIATVAGQAGERATMDARGRIKIRLHWLPADDPENWMWALIAKRAGSSTDAPPRAGSTVVLDYEAGDLQRPVVLDQLGR